MSNKVVIPDSILDSLTAVKDSGLINMADIKGIKELVPTEVSMWIDENKDSYMQGFFFGFVKESDVK